MPSPKLNLVVIRVSDIEAAHRFYSALGLSFAKHAHGKGPTHYASDEGSVVFEIYQQIGTDDAPQLDFDSIIRLRSHVERSHGTSNAPLLGAFGPFLRRYDCMAIRLPLNPACTGRKDSEPVPRPAALALAMTEHNVT